MTTTGAPQRWCIITCEYPPLPGGVSDHTFLLAQALTQTGDIVDVWTAPSVQPAPPLPGVTVHQLPSLFRFDALLQLRRMLHALPRDTRVLVQYVPTGYGWRMMNIAFALLLFSQRRRGLDIYFHEVGFKVREEVRLRRKFAGVVHLMMNWLSVRAASRLFVAIPDWERRLRRLGVDSGVEWVPVPSNVPVTADAARVEAIRDSLRPFGSSIVGHFGTFGRFHVAALQRALTTILDDGAGRVALLIGRRSTTMRDVLVAARPDLAKRIVATGGIAPHEVSEYLSASDVLLQPYDDGASARRGSLMAGLALGRPVVSNRGAVTGASWTEHMPVRLAHSTDAPALAAAVGELLDDLVERNAIGERGQALYREMFAMERTLDRLRGDVTLVPAATFPSVLMLHTTLPSRGRKPGGVEVAVHRLANALVDLRVPVTVASLTDAPLDARYAHRRLFRRMPWLHESRLGRLVVLPVLLNGMILDGSDVVHYHGDDWFVLRRPHATVRTLHGSALREAQRATKWQRRMVQYLLYPLERLAAQLATISVAVGRDAAELHGLTRVIGNGVDPEVFMPGAKSTVPTVLYVGTWEGRKRGRWMYDLFVNEIVDRHPAVELHFIADVAPPAHPRVRFQQFPDDKALAVAYREAWLFALPSTYEGFGIPYLEAMSSGTAVLATPNTGARELLGDGEFGALPEDADFAAVLLALLGDDVRRARLARAGYERSREFSWERVAQSYAEVYREAITLHDRPSEVTTQRGGDP